MAGRDCATLVHSERRSRDSHTRPLVQKPNFEPLHYRFQMQTFFARVIIRVFDGDQTFFAIGVLRILKKQAFDGWTAARRVILNRVELVPKRAFLVINQLDFSFVLLSLRFPEIHEKFDSRGCSGRFHG